MPNSLAEVIALRMWGVRRDAISLMLPSINISAMDNLDEG
jgi:hypothetical protein